jgi:hypothetical protein
MEIGKDRVMSNTGHDGKDASTPQATPQLQSRKRKRFNRFSRKRGEHPPYMRLLEPVNDRQWFLQNPKRHYRLRRITTQEEAALATLIGLPKEWRGMLIVLARRRYHPRYGGFRNKLYFVGEISSGELRPGGGFPGCCDIDNDAMLSDLWRRVEERRPGPRPHHDPAPLRRAIVEMEDDTHP